MFDQFSKKGMIVKISTLTNEEYFFKSNSKSDAKKYSKIILKDGFYTTEIDNYIKFYPSHMVKFIEVYPEK